MQRFRYLFPVTWSAGGSFTPGNRLLAMETYRPQLGSTRDHWELDINSN
jgi:hypothetical protein